MKKNVEVHENAKYLGDKDNLGDGIIIEKGLPVAQVKTLSEAILVANRHFEDTIKPAFGADQPLRADYEVFARQLGLCTDGYARAATVKIWTVKIWPAKD